MYVGNLKNYDSYGKRFLVKRISGIDDKQRYKELFKLVVNENIEYSKNK